MVISEQSLLFRLASFPKSLEHFFGRTSCRGQFPEFDQSRQFGLEMLLPTLGGQFQDAEQPFAIIAPKVMFGSRRINLSDERFPHLCSWVDQFGIRFD